MITFSTSRNRRATTLTEVMISVPIAAAFGILTVTVLAVSGFIFKDITDESQFRKDAGWVMINLERDLRSSESAMIAADYTATPTATTYNGNCIYIVNLTNPTGEQNRAYYFYQDNAWQRGRIYRDLDTSTPPDPDDDEELTRNATAFEVRRNPTGAGAEYRIAIRGDAKTQRIMGSTSAQGNRLIISTTIRPRRN